MIRVGKWQAMVGAAALGLALVAPFGPGMVQAQQTATAAMQDASGNALGTLTVTQVSGGVQVSGTLRGLPPGGEHGFHFHQTGRCEPPSFMSAGDHFNPTGRQHGLNNPAGPHVADLPNLRVGADGTVNVNATTRGGTLAPGPESLLDADGSALMIHANADDNVTDPSGNSGGRIACGVVMASAQAQPSPAAKPAAPAQPAAPKPVAAPAQAPKPVAQPAAKPAAAPAQTPAALPRTGDSDWSVEILAALGLVTLVGGLGLRRRFSRG